MPHVLCDFLIFYTNQPYRHIYKPKKMKLLSYNTKVAFIVPKVASKKKSLTKPIDMRSSFEELVMRNPTVKAKLDFDA